ncbi:MAG: glycosyltransferase family 39 protein [bacterium]|nr:glycosyltransferase family 39 protein [bacterium]
MNIKKIKSSWFFFAIYVITYLYLGVCIGKAMSTMLNLGGAALSCIMVVMVILLAFVGCAAALIVLMKARPKNEKAEVRRRRRRALRKDSFFVKELLPALASYLLVVVSRGVYIVQFSGGKLTGNVGLYERICSGAGVEFDVFHGIERLYAYLLKGFCILLGNVPDAVYMLNLICQVILAFCCYLFLRAAAGKAAAVSASVLFLCVPYFYHALIDCGPAQLFMALCIAVVCTAAYAVRRSVFELGGKGMYPAYLVCGLASGILLALDLTALLIPVTVVVVFLVSVRGRRMELACYVFGVLIGIPAGMVLLNMDPSGVLFSAKPASEPFVTRAVHDFGSYIGAYESGLFSPALFVALPKNLVILCVIAFGGIAAVLFFWCGHDVLRIIAIPYFLTVLFAVFDIGSAVGSDTGFLIACAGVLTAALTVGMIYLIGQPVTEVEARRKKADAEKEADGAHERRLGRKKKSDEAGGGEESVESVSQEKTADVSEKKRRKKEKKAVKEEAQRKNTAEGKPQEEKPRLIENPLPLPKKREHREMDYAREVPTDRMHYDVEVRDGDDFDR